ncbi:hypothetical protein AXF42_Ash009385 [Apostasia shenzhenica]|uniref:Basic secretory protease n=1 Tax=Apostasia shenzhenica TaxID=1088818 RepID=A0A2I0B3Y7_9ASPA|nr:hypothetical protein AXF42_Ash009385 [Apostasia shenzhenica]
MEQLRLPTPSLALLLAAVAVAATATAAQPVYEVVNNAQGTAGGNRFEESIGPDYTKQVLAEAASFIWSTFAQSAAGDRKNVDHVTVIIESMGGVAYTSNNEIHFSAEYIENFSGDVKQEFTGVLYHESTHVWQWSGQGQAPSGLIEGIADYVRLTAGYEPADGHWVKPGEGSRWDQGYDVTARFLVYLDGLRRGFVAELNRKMKDGYSDDFFKELLGKPVDQLFTEYKQAYGH